MPEQYRFTVVDGVTEKVYVGFRRADAQAMAKASPDDRLVVVWWEDSAEMWLVQPGGMAWLRRYYYETVGAEMAFHFYQMNILQSGNFGRSAVS